MKMASDYLVMLFLFRIGIRLNHLCQKLWSHFC